MGIKNIKKHTLSFLAIVVLSMVLNLVALDKAPAGVTADEIQQGYTGYSLLKTGRDEWGDLLPINPRGFGDYKPPLYSYLTIPFIALLGLDITAVRLPAAIAGVISVGLVYFLAKELFKSEKVGLLASFFLAISSWHVYFSRFAWESNVGLMLFLLGATSFLYARKERSYLIIISALAFGLSLFSYHSFKIVSTLFLVGVIFYYRKHLFSIKREKILIALGVFAVLLAIAILGFMFFGGGRRASDVAIYKEENLSDLRNTQVSDELPQPFNRVVNNRIDFLISRFAQNYLAYFSTVFLNSPNRSDSSVFNLPGQWLIPLWQTIFFVYGLFLLIVRKNPYTKLLGLWLIIAPIPAALAKEYMQTQRVHVMLVLFPMIASFGVVEFFNKLRNRLLKKTAYLFLIFLIFWVSVKNIDYYFYHQFDRNLGGMKYGYSEIVSFAHENEENYEKIIFTKKNSEPSIFVAFYTKMDPSVYQNYSKNWINFEKDFAFLDMMNFEMGKYSFMDIKWREVLDNRNSLLIAAPDEIPQDWPKIKEVKNNRGEVIFVAVDLNKI